MIPSQNYTAFSFYSYEKTQKSEGDEKLVKEYTKLPEEEKLNYVSVAQMNDFDNVMYRTPESLEIFCGKFNSAYCAKLYDWYYVFIKKGENPKTKALTGSLLPPNINCPPVEKYYKLPIPSGERPEYKLGDEVLSLKPKQNQKFYTSIFYSAIVTKTPKENGTANGPQNNRKYTVMLSDGNEVTVPEYLIVPKEDKWPKIEDQKGEKKGEKEKQKDKSKKKSEEKQKDKDKKKKEKQEKRKSKHKSHKEKSEAQEDDEKEPRRHKHRHHHRHYRRHHRHEYSDYSDEYSDQPYIYITPLIINIPSFQQFSPFQEQPQLPYDSNQQFPFLMQ